MGGGLRARNPTQSSCWTLNLPQAFVLLMWPPPHHKPYPLLHPVPACPARSQQTGCFQLCTRKEVSDQNQVWRGGVVPAISPAEIGFLFSEYWQGPGLDNGAHVPALPVFSLPR